MSSWPTPSDASGRRPYGAETVNVNTIGLKRLEANKSLRFQGVTEGNFNSILRRAFDSAPAHVGEYMKGRVSLRRLGD